MFTPLVCLPAPAPVQPPALTDEQSKARLRSALEATGLKFETTASGLSFSVAFTHANDRRQTIYVSLSPSSVGPVRVHAIYTTLWYDPANPPSEALLRDVLTRTKKLGHFYLFKDSKGTWAIRFGAHFDVTDLRETSQPGDRHVNTLKDLIYFVNAVGEETDKALNGDKDIK